MRGPDGEAPASAVVATTPFPAVPSVLTSRPSGRELVSSASTAVMRSPRTPRASPFKDTNPSRSPLSGDRLGAPASPPASQGSSWWSQLRLEPVVCMVFLMLFSAAAVWGIWLSPRRAGAPMLWIPSSNPQPADHQVLSCSPDQAFFQAEMFKTRPVIESACPEHAWVQDYQALWPAGHKIILDIGCNLGYQSVEFFDSFVPELGVNKKSLYGALEGEPEKSRCNVCDSKFYPGECQAVHNTAPLPPGQTRSLDLYAFEPGDVHYPRLLRSRQRLFAAANASVGMEGPGPVKQSGGSQGRWFLFKQAVSNVSGQAAFSQGCTDGRCSLLGGSSSEYMVKVTTADDFVAAWKLPRVDIMKVDTEGYDATVLQGARRLLSRRAVATILFEYHKLNVWNSTQLRDVVSWLEDLGYVCYLEGRPYLYKLSRSCWDPRYEFHDWSNVVCGLSDGPIEKLLDQRSYLHVLHTRTHSRVAAPASATPAGTTSATRRPTSPRRQQQQRSRQSGSSTLRGTASGQPPLPVAQLVQDPGQHDEGQVNLIKAGG